VSRQGIARIGKWTNGGQRLQGELTPEDGRDLDRQLFLGGQLVDARGQHTLDGEGNVCEVRARYPRFEIEDACSHGGRAATVKHQRELLAKQRVSVTAGDDPEQQLRRKALGADPPSNDFGDRVRGEGQQRHFEDLSNGGARFRDPGVALASGARGHEHDRSRATRHYVLEELPGG
jgi:hypothetical protein